ncbi:MAG: hypothetical protein ACYTDY_12720 [Planctomycetota bacterium]|jgi:outer membrane lipoprotein-sorting protein
MKLFRLACLAVVVMALSGCVFSIGGGGWDADLEERIEELEERVENLEEAVGEHSEATKEAQ